MPKSRPTGVEPIRVQPDLAAFAGVTPKWRYPMLSWPKERRLSFGSISEIVIAAAPAKRWAAEQPRAEGKYPTVGKLKRQEPWPSVEISLSAATTIVRA